MPVAAHTRQGRRRAMAWSGRLAADLQVWPVLLVPRTRLSGPPAIGTGHRPRPRSAEIRTRPRPRSRLCQTRGRGRGPGGLGPGPSPPHVLRNERFGPPSRLSVKGESTSGSCGTSRNRDFHIGFVRGAGEIGKPGPWLLPHWECPSHISRPLALVYRLMS